MEKGYRAFVDVYNERYYVDTNTGEGFDKVLAKIDPLLNKFASTLYVPGFKFEDAKSELSIIAIEGIMSFDPHRDVKLSTFLHKHIHNKKISLIKSENKMSNDAFSLQLQEEKGEASPKIRKVREALNFSQFKINNAKDEQTTLFENTIADDNASLESSIIKSRYDKTEFESSLEKACERLDSKTKKIIELMYFEDYSIKDAADAVGLSGWAASMRLKKLASKSSIKNIFGITEEFTPMYENDADDEEIVNESGRTW
jgi:RNA polymerase sigma factor (sigma-70 family)